MSRSSTGVFARMKLMKMNASPANVTSSCIELTKPSHMYFGASRPANAPTTTNPTIIASPMFRLSTAFQKTMER